MNGKKIFWICFSAVVGVVLFLAALGMLIYMKLATHLPVERPEQFSFEIYEGGGMEDESLSYYLHNGHMVYSKEYGSSEVTAELDLTEEELEYIWQTLRVERFDRIREHDGGDVYDRGGTTLRLTYGDENIGMSDSGSSFISGDSSTRFYAIETAVIGVVQPFIDQAKRTVVVDVSAELLPNIESIQLNDQSLYSTYVSSTTKELPGHASVLPGEYLLYVSTLVPPAITSDYQQLDLTVSGSANVLISGTPDALVVTQESIIEHPTE